jgi:hypothetical protein
MLNIQYNQHFQLNQNEANYSVEASAGASDKLVDKLESKLHKNLSVPKYWTAGKVHALNFDKRSQECKKGMCMGEHITINWLTR